MKEVEGRVIQYIDDYAYGVTPEGKTICLGTETDIRAILANPRKHPQNPTIAQVISVERQLTKQGEKKSEEEKDKEKMLRAERHQKAVEMGLARKQGRSRKIKIVPKK